jgi:hypothetical protein
MRRLGVRAAGERRFRRAARETDVEDLRATVAREERVLRLQVAVNDALLVRRGEAACDARARTSVDPPSESASWRRRSVWVDRRLVAEEHWIDRPEQPTRLLRFGSDGADALDLEPGGHDVEVEVAWDGKRRTARIWGGFKRGAPRRLRAKVGGVLNKNLSLEWN